MTQCLVVLRLFCNSSVYKLNNDKIMCIFFHFWLVPSHSSGISVLDFVQRITVQVAARGSREHLVQHRRTGYHGSRRFCLQHGVRNRRP